MTNPQPLESDRFAPATLLRAAQLYYSDHRGQLEVAAELGVSRSTVSRMLAEARRVGIVEITIKVPESEQHPELAERLAARLGIRHIYWAAAAPGEERGETLRRPAVQALREVRLSAGDLLLVSSGRMLYSLSRRRLLSLPGVRICPTVGGLSEPEAWYQTNEIVRALAETVGGTPTFVWAPAMPSPMMRESLDHDSEFQVVTDSWGRAKAALVGIGAPTSGRVSISASIPTSSRHLRRAAGDICLNFFDQAGRALSFPGSDRMVRIGRDQLRAVPHVIGVASGPEKVSSIIAAARSGMFNTLVTDRETLDLLAAQLIN